MDRRNVLIGLGGLYGATATNGSKGRMTAIGAPVQAPDLSTCHQAVDAVTNEPVSCCPPYSTAPANVVDYVLPSQKEPLRVRKAAHKLTTEETEKFKEAITKMKALPADDPWNYYQQATIHCTYCNGAFDQAGFNPAVPLQVHGSWLFLPWHRYYIYFWERILGKLIDDPTFAIPYWNWDAPEGMYMPKMYLDESSTLYNDNRDKSHYSSVLDYNYSHGDPNPSTESQIKEVITSNLCQLDNMYREALWSPSLYMGKPLRAGQISNSSIASGSSENLHLLMHVWTGSATSPYHDMGNFVTVARDTMFFAHHANVDRMWDIYSYFRGYKPEFKDPDWLDSSFIFYDENRQVVKVKVKDCLMPQNLRYSYSPERLPWKDISRKCKKSKSAKKKSAGESVQLVPVSEFGSKPRSLTETIRAIVPRPKTSRRKDEKEDATEVLLIEGIEVPQGKPARFDVYVTKPTEGLVGPDKGELAGSFVNVPHSHHKARTTGPKVNLELGITGLVENIEAEASDKLVVTLVPRMGDVTVGGVHVELFKVDEDED